MMEINQFKKEVKEWIQTNPDGTLEALADYCEELIPPAQFASYQWLVTQTLSWYEQILKDRKYFSKDTFGPESDEIS